MRPKKMQCSVIVLLAMLAATTARAETPDEVQARIFNSFLRTANEGDMNSQFVVGHRYEVGVGTAKDLEKAFYWYGQAAERGHPLAKLKMEERKRAEAPAAQQAAPARVKGPPPVVKPPKPTPVAVKTPKKAPEKPKEVREEPKEVREPKPVERTIDALSIVLRGQWLQDRQAAEYLPSTKASCLQANDAEVVCFSQELSRVVNDATFTYTVKSSLSNFTKDGRFSVNYLYHVADIDKDRKGSGGQPVGPREFQHKLGWQEPGHRLECRVADDESISCVNDKKQIRFTKK